MQSHIKTITLLTTFCLSISSPNALLKTQWHQLKHQAQRVNLLSPNAANSFKVKTNLEIVASLMSENWTVRKAKVIYFTTSAKKIATIRRAASGSDIESQTVGSPSGPNVVALNSILGPLFQNGYSLSRSLQFPRQSNGNVVQGC